LLRRVGCAAALACLLAGTGGCAVGPDYKKPAVTVPSDWRPANDPRIASRIAADSVWWKAFGDPALDRLVELAYHQNLPLQVAALRIVEARAQLGIATGKLYPQTQEAFANANAIGLSQNIAKIGSLPRNYVGYQVGFDAAWEIDVWGKYRRGVESVAADMAAALGDYDSALVSLTAEVARTYVTVRSIEVLIEQAKENVRIQEQALDIAQSRFRNGATSELDPTQARTILESTRASIPRQQASLQQAKNALSALLGQPPGTADALLEGPKALPKVPAKVAVGVPAEMLRRRPDIRTAELHAASQGALIGVAKADFYPSFSLLGTIGLDATTRGTASANLFRSGSIFYSVGPDVHWALFNYGRITNAVRVADARFQQLLVAYRDTVIKAAQEVDDALAGFLDGQEAAVLSQNAVTSAKRAVELSLAAYQEGAVDYQRVLDAERALLDQQTSLTDASTGVVTSLIALYKALGGGWEVRQGAPIVPEETQREMKARTDWGDMLSPPTTPETKNTASAGKH
jgi:NodT family efflux transporter outer membrane factor (OMF) lipoprotein